VRQGRLDEAEAAFSRLVDVYRKIYDDKHYYIGVALSNLAGVYQQRKQYARAEGIFRDVLRRYGETLPVDHQLVAIAHVRLGRQIAFQKRYADALAESLAGYELLMKQANPPAAWIDIARQDLVTEYEGLGQRERALPFRNALAQATTER